jgi:glycosyltransferase involved in cell wall biosynthesis
MVRLRNASEAPDIAFACAWWRPRPPTWSHIPRSLRSGLETAGAALVDVDAQPRLPLQAAAALTLTAAGQRPWKYAPAYRDAEIRRVRRRVARVRPRAVLEMADLVAPTDFPTYGYQDMNFTVALDLYDELGPEMVSTVPADRAVLQRLADQQQPMFELFDGVFTMGRWYRDHLVERQGLDASRVHAVGGGVSDAYVDGPVRNIRDDSDRTNVLFVGTEFHRKGGDHVVGAVRLLNDSGDRPVRLTVVGPPTWPLRGDPPPHVDYRGALDRSQVAELFASSDVFVMPSRYEAYGLVFLEARSMGIPAIGRDAYAMPDLIEPGVGGAVWNGKDVGDLASMIDSTLRDDELHERCARDAREFAATHTWACVGRRIRDVLTRDLDPTRSAPRSGTGPEPQARREVPRVRAAVVDPVRHRAGLVGGEDRP